MNTKIIACTTVIEELQSLLPPHLPWEVLGFGLHTNPDALKDTLEETISSALSTIETIILGHGLCSQAVVGLEAEDQTLVIPRVDDCIGIFPGQYRLDRYHAYAQRAAARFGPRYEEMERALRPSSGT